MITKEEKTKYLRIALNMQGICINERTSHQIINTYESILEKGGSFTLSDAVDIEKNIVLYYEMKQKEVTTTKNE